VADAAGGPVGAAAEAGGDDGHGSDETEGDAVPAGGDVGGGGAAASGGGGGASGGGQDGASRGGGGGAAARGASCDGFKNGPGITDSHITLANVADISGPVPGIFEASQQGARAFVDFFNSQNDICGRKLRIVNLDSRADAGADQRAYTQACDEAFAAVGSMGAFDSGGAAVAENCGLPDLRAASVTPERDRCKTCFSTHSTKVWQIPDAYAKWMMENHRQATQNVGVLYINGGAAPINARSQWTAWEKVGWNIKYTAGIDSAEFNFAPYVQQMRDNGVRMVVYTGPYQHTVRLQQAMQQQGFKPDVYLQDPTIYDHRYTQQAGGLAKDVYVYSTTDLFTNSNNAEMQQYLAWIQQVRPGAIPNFYGVYSWSAARLFVETAQKLGGNLTRENLVAELRKVDKWTGNGIHTEMAVGAGTTPNCLMVIQYDGSKWVKRSPGKFMCGRTVDTGIGK
jgi:ABC-type branched-subunit amino acid transport system substrate-binding protein